jgi:hypothetical protein
LDRVPGTGQTAMVIARFLALTGPFLRSQSPPCLIGTGICLSETKRNKREWPPLHHSVWQLRLSIYIVTYPINYHDIVIWLKKYELHITIFSYVLDIENRVHRIRYFSCPKAFIPSLGPHRLILKKEYLGDLDRGQSGRGVKLVIHLIGRRN